jgi:chorismate mutase
MFVGELKLFDVINLEESETGYLGGEKRFCKKRLMLTKEELVFKIVGEPSIPIPQCLSSQGFILNLEAQEVQWRSLHLDLCRYETKLPQHKVYADTLRARFLEIYPHCWPPRHEVTTRYISPKAKWTTYGEYNLTEPAMNVIASFADIQEGDVTYLDSIEERIRYGLNVGRLRMISGLKADLEFQLVVCRHQTEPIIKEVSVHSVGVVPDVALLDRIRIICYK